LPLPVFIFCVFSPEIACQAPKPPKSLKQNKIQLAFKLSPIRYTRYRNQEKPRPKAGASPFAAKKSRNPFAWNILDATPLL
jgi:hypothetical protein